MEEVAPQGAYQARNIKTLIEGYHAAEIQRQRAVKEINAIKTRMRAFLLGARLNSYSVLVPVQEIDYSNVPGFSPAHGQSLVYTIKSSTVDCLVEVHCSVLISDPPTPSGGSREAQP